MCNCAKRRGDIAAGARALLRGDIGEAARRAAEVSRSARIDLELARRAASARAIGLIRR
ncbi:hypothetical protein ABE438_17455 [Bosea sp. TWI1241]|uniref:hypothetical protein n=1 Tax=Bosea sp. TWI1241 TaxID=3148904 RepID=UPI003208D083